jgi:sulfur carrier protein ThiS
VIQLILHGEMRRFAGGRRSLDVAAGPGTVAELLALVAVPIDESAALIVNGEQRDAGTPVADGDTVEVLPAISGGFR